MKNYEEFKEALKAAMEESFGEGYEVRISDVKKADGAYEGISVQKDCEDVSLESEDVAVTLNLQKLYNAYERDGEANCFMSAIQAMKKGLASLSDVTRSLDREYILENVILALDNAEKKASLMKEVPYRMLVDLVVYYRVYLDKQGDSVATILLTNTIANKAGLSEEDLYQAALKNTRRITPIHYSSIEEELYHQEGKELSGNIEDLPDGEMIYIISNCFFTKGAVYMADEQALKDMADKIGTGFYIIPSSIHEILAVRPAAISSVSELNHMIWYTNNDMLKKGDELSDHAYYYDPEKRTVCLADAIAD